MRAYFTLMGGLGMVLGCAAGCAVASSGSEPLERDVAGVCSMPDATTIAVAELAVTIGIELHRWELLTDFQVYTGYGNRQMLGLTSAGLAQCGGSCPLTASMLALQDDRMDQTVVLGGAWLDAASFASRLVSGFTNQQTCVLAGQCPYEAHVLDIELQTPQACGDLDTFLVSAPAGGNLANTANLNNALYWTANNGANPLINFQSTATSVRIDPTGAMHGGEQQIPSGVCSIFSPDVNLNGSPCSCGANNVNDGQLVNDKPLQRSTYYCRTVWGCSQYSPDANLAAMPCICADQGIFENGVMRNDKPLQRSTYYCRYNGDRCQVLGGGNLTGAPCTCADSGVTHGHLTNSKPVAPNVFFCE